jgi:kumamolisin
MDHRPGSAVVSFTIGVGVLMALVLSALLLVPQANRGATSLVSMPPHQYSYSLRSLTAASRDLGRASSCCTTFDVELHNRGLPAVSDGTRYGRIRFLSAGQMNAFGPRSGFIHALSAALTRHHLTLRWETGQSWALIRGWPRAVAAAFHVSIRRYQAPNGVRFVASRRDPTVPRFLRQWVSAVGRISSLPSVHPAVILGGFSPTGLLKAYDVAPLRAHGFAGAGETVVFPEIDGVDQAALSQFDHLYHLPAPRLTFHGAQFKAGDEATMDVEVVHEIAPKAHLVVYNLDGQVTNAQWTVESLNMLKASAGDIVSSSVGGCDGTYDSADAQIYKQVLHQADITGVAMFASSGDNGAFDCIVHGQVPGNSALGVDMPAALPGVTGVGGTTLAVNSSGGWAHEAAWEGPIETSGGGGGVSRFFTLPSWQKALGDSTAMSMNPEGRRMVPDVSADADPVSGASLIFPDGSGQGGGTSQAAPIWAGITALIDGYLKHNNHQAIGFMNPALYHLAETTQPYPPFHDVTVGSNLHYPAGRGYDMATGLGTPNAWNLARDLAAYQASHGR